MTKKKKVQTLTIEEKLKQALVADWEQPYRVPENWLWTRLGQITQVVGGGTPSTSHLEYYDEGNIPWITPADLSNFNDIYIYNGNKNITKIGLDKSSAKLMPCGTVLLSSRAPIGYVAIAGNELSTNQGFKSFLPCKIFLSKYLFWYLKGIKHILESYASGTTFLELSGSKAAQVEFPLPPLAEQRRIVSRIESLFEKLDHARELVQSALDSFESRKAAILHKAFTGELTAKWREKNGVKLESWKTSTLDKVCNKITDGTHHSPKNLPVGDFLYITAKNIKENYISLENVTYVSAEDHKKIHSRCDVEYGDVLYIKDGATTGIATINSITEEFSMLSSVALIKPNVEIIKAKYIVYYLNSPNVKAKMINNMSGNAITRLTIAKIKDAEIGFPSLSEQQEIVRILDSLLEKEQHAEDKLEPILDQIDLMKKSILARAFRGELGTNDPSEERAIELLKEVLQQKEALSAKKIVAKRPKPLKIPIDIAKAMETSLEKDIYTLIKKNKFLPINSIMDISSKKLNVIDALRKLEQKNIICKKADGLYYCLG